MIFLLFSVQQHKTIYFDIEIIANIHNNKNGLVAISQFQWKNVHQKCTEGFQ